MSNIGFIGLGIMGKPMARNLISSNHSIFLYSSSGVPKELIAQGENLATLLNKSH